jgi:hypothetical protein
MEINSSISEKAKEKAHRQVASDFGNSRGKADMKTLWFSFWRDSGEV